MDRTSKNICLLTKVYPFGSLESYLNNEIPILSAQFENVFIYAVDDYKGEHLNPLIAKYSNVHVLQLNSSIPSFGWLHKLKRNSWAMWQWLIEIIRGRDGKNHWQNRALCFSYMAICYDRAHVLSQAFRERGIKNIVFYNYWLHRGTIISFIARKKFMQGSAVVSRAHSSDLYHKDWNTIIKLANEPFMPFEWLKIHHSDYIFPISQHGFNHFQRVFGLTNEKQMVSRLGVLDHHQLGPTNQSKVFRLVTCSGITGNKRPAFLLEVLKAMRHVPLEWVHIGKHTGEIADQLKEDLQKENLSDRVVFMGSMKNEAIFEFYRTNQVNCFINLSKAEGIPVSVMEALSFGIPAIVTNTVGNPEAVDSSCGVVVDVDLNLKEIVDALTKMIEDADYYNALRIGARLKYLRDFDAETNYKQLFDTIKQRFG